MDFNYIILSIPLFFLLIGVELIVDRVSKKNNYRFNDAIANISCGMGEQVTGVFFKLFIVTLYAIVYTRYSFYKIPVNWTSGIILFLGADFFYYWFHRYSHVINLFWGGHVVHHQSEEYNLSVALRQGWFQKFFSFAFYLPLALIGFNPVQFLTISSLITLYQFWIHTRHIGKLGVLEYVVNTPSHHRVHHGVNPKYIDKNHAGALIIWDRLFGTFQEEEEEPVYGITQPINTWDPIKANLQHWQIMYHDLKKMRGLKDKLRYTFMPPGWKPAYITDTHEPLDLVNVKKYDTAVSGAVNYYVFFQYLIILGAATFFLFNTAALSMGRQLLACGLIIAGIVNFSSLFESKSYAVVLELLRIGVSVAALILYFHIGGMLWLAAICAWALISACWLFGIKKQGA